MSIGAAGELIRQTVSPSDNHVSAIMSEVNVTRLVDNLSQMRGAALKLGQLMSIQGASLLYLNSSY